MNSRVIAGQFLGTSIGAIQTPLLRENADRKYPKSSFSSLKGYGYPSVLAGIIGGTLTLGAAVYGSYRGGWKDEVVSALLGYGTVALETGVFSGIYPAVTEADCVKAGGVWNATDHTCKKPATTTTGMYSSSPPQVQHSGVDMSMFRQMSSELQRLSQENANLRTHANPPSTPYSAAEVQRLSQELANVKTQLNQVMPGGPVYKRQQRYGFMEPETYERDRLAPETLQSAPGQPTKRAKGFGFMEGATPVSKVQAIKTRFDFSG